MLDNKASFPKRMPVGVYEKQICHKCEVSLGPGDGYIKIFLNSKPYTVKGEGVVGYVYNEYNLDLIEKFVLSLLWRSSISQHDCFNAVRLGDDFETKVKNYLIGKTERPSEVQYYFKKFDQCPGILMPIRLKVESLNTYLFNLGMWNIYIKVDSRPLIGVLEEFADHSHEIWVIHEEFRNSDSYKVMLNLANLNKKYFKTPYDS
jgi:hypothetical protein